MTLVYTGNEAADLLHVGRDTVYKWLDEGLIPAFRVGADWKVSAAGLEKFVIERAEMEAEERRKINEKVQMEQEEV